MRTISSYFIQEKNIFNKPALVRNFGVYISTRSQVLQCGRSLHFSQDFQSFFESKCVAQPWTHCLEHQKQNLTNSASSTSIFLHYNIFVDSFALLFNSSVHFSEFLFCSLFRCVRLVGEGKGHLRGRRTGRERTARSVADTAKLILHCLITGRPLPACLQALSLFYVVSLFPFTHTHTRTHRLEHSVTHPL